MYIRMSLDWNDLRYFLSVARTGRLTEASRRLGTDHATVSRRIKALEGALDARLFERSPRGYALTEAGERLLAHAERMESSAARMQSEIAGENMTLGGAVRVGAPDGFGTIFLAPRIGTLNRRYPELDLQIVAMPRVFSLSKREADIAIGLARPTEGRLVTRKLTDYRLHLYASRSYLDENNPIESPADLSDHVVIGYIPDLIFTPELDYLPQVSSQIKPRLTSSNLIAQMRAARAGAGLCILPDFMALEDPGLVSVLRDEIDLVRTFWLILHADLHDIARVRAVADFIVAEVEAARDLFMPDNPSIA
ncbi:LysR family transcriptional regulator [Microbaculum marinisediminis]|uniref:LysR family transcriptional regulator n=1 Tax=Microbaculum marinisediminis TaxID=2931392 RepID=A0AAW5QY89_9HYPH|nr:LysR family transcriptional regulator [Microbaculum sp. A6E488]MCT8973026.1 LysR family transcriptional regulator [Microbaculum sp. A6E488]